MIASIPNRKEMEMQITHPYCCTLVPAGMLPEQVELAANSKALLTVMVQAPNADAARGRVHRATGLAVHDVVRMEAAEVTA